MACRDLAQRRRLLLVPSRELAPVPGGWRENPLPADFSVDASVRIEADNRAGLERLLRYCARPPFALQRLEAIDAHRLMYQLSKPQPDGHTEVMLTPLELIDRLAALIPPPHTHRHRYHGVLAPNAALRAAVTALAPEASNDAQQQTEKKHSGDAAEDLWRSPARYLWAMLLARIYESAPLACPRCGADMRLIAFVTDDVSVRRILGHIGEPADPPRITPARGPPVWEEGVEPVALLDSLAQPEPGFEFDQTVSW